MDGARQRAAEYMTAAGMAPGTIDAGELCREMLAEMERGLAGEPASLAMLPSYLDVAGSVPAGLRAIAIDAGGTHLRAALVSFDERRGPRLERESRAAMPDRRTPLPARSFYDRFAQLIAPLAARADRIGFCFSYPVAMQPGGDGRVLALAKEIDAPEVVGSMVLEELRSALRRAEAGHDHSCVLLNDTVACLLAGQAVAGFDRHDSFVGFVLGTGTNVCYREENRRISKLGGLADGGRQIINVEAGGFDRAPRGAADRRLDAASAASGRYLLEKMMGGAYLGPLVHQVLRDAADAGLLSPASAAGLEGLEVLETGELDRFLRHRLDGAGSDGPLDRRIAERDAAIACHLGDLVIERAALFAAVTLTAAAVRSAGDGGDPPPVALAIDGTTFYRLRGLQPYVRAHLDDLLVRRHGHRYRILSPENAPLVGAAIAALTATDA